MLKKRMILLSLIVLLTISSLLIILPIIHSDITDIFPESGSVINDTYIGPVYNNPIIGTLPGIRVGNDSNGEVKALIKFDISLISSTDTVSNATLQLYVNSSSGSDNNRIIKVYKMTADWSEIQANWSNRDSANPWTNPGADYDPDELSYTIVSNQTGQYYNFTIPKKLVQGWVNNSIPNYGLILISNNTAKGNYTTFSSSTNSVEASTPKLIIKHSSNYAPTIISIITNGNDSSNPINAGNNISFIANWTDPEANQGQLFVCNSSDIHYSTGCGGKTFCNTSLEDPYFEDQGISSCNYTTLSTDNTTTKFYYAVCDSGSLNCSSIQNSTFYVNHAPNIIIIHPNSTEIVNQSKGNYNIKFNVSDSDNNPFNTADIFLGTQTNPFYYLINTIQLALYCTSPQGKTSLPNNCTYPWNSTGIWGNNFFITINVSDNHYFSSLNYSSNFSIRSKTDSNPPNMSEPWTNSYTSDLHSGQIVNFFINTSDESPPITAWIEINSTPLTTINMTNILDETFECNWTAFEIGNYAYKIHVEDIIPNSNESAEYNLRIRKPSAENQNEFYPSSTLPYHLIMVTGELNSTDNLKGVNATLNVPSGFNFLNGYPQNSSLGDFNYNETKQAIWVLSTPILLGNYSLNITYEDRFRNSWQSNNLNVTVTNSIGSGPGNASNSYSLSIAGYPYVIRKENYSVTAYFTLGGNLIQPDNMTITIIQPDSTPVINYPTSMTNINTGIFNHITPTDLSWPEGQWETIINATLNGHSYLQYQFWRLLGTVFDVNFLGAIDPHNNNLTLSVSLENKGQQSGVDGKIIWNVTSPTGEILAWKSQDVNVNAGEIKIFNVTFDTSGGQYPNLTNYTGPATVTVTYLYPSPTYGQIAGSSGPITIVAQGALYCGDHSCNNGEDCNSCQTDCGVCSSPSGPSNGGGGSGGGGISINKTSIAQFQAIFDKIIYLTKNIEKTVIIQVKNTGKQDLTNISIKIKDLNESFYTITLDKIAKLKPEETGNFKIKFLVLDFKGEQNFNYVISSNELTKTEPVKISALNIKDYFLKELERLRNRSEKIKNNLNDNKTIIELDQCNNIIDEVQFDVDQENFINARDDVTKADDCLDNIESKQKGVISFPKINNQIGWAITWLLLIILILILVWLAYSTYKKISLFNFFKKKSETIQQEGVKKDYIDEKIKSIEEKLKD
jgi:hypothetical protein